MIRGSYFLVNGALLGLALVSCGDGGARGPARDDAGLEIISLTVTPTDCGLHLSWSPAPDAIQGYDTRSAVSPAKPSATGAYGLSASASSADFTGLLPGVTYNVGVFGYGYKNALVAEGFATGVPTGTGTCSPDASSDSSADATDASATDAAGSDSLAADTLPEAPTDTTPDTPACTALLTSVGSRLSLKPDDTGVVLADIKKDGKLDAIVAGRGSTSVAVLLGNGDGTFAAPAYYATAQNPLYVAAGDINGDGIPDVVVAAAPTSAGAISVLFGKSDGTLQPHVDYTTGVGTSAVALADVDGKTGLDVIVVNATSNNAGVLLNDGTGKLAAEKDYPVGAAPSDVAVVDMNKDTILDIVAMNATDGSVSVLIGNGDGTFRAKNDYGTDAVPTAIAVGDVNGDGYPDVIAATASSTATPSVISILLNDKTGALKPKSSLNTEKFPNGVRIADFNADGKVDLVVGAAGADAVVVHLGNGDGTFGAATKFSTPTGSGPANLAVGDITGKKKNDVFVLLTAVDQAMVFKNWCP